MPPALLMDQPSLDGFCPVTEAVERLALDTGTEARGAVYTRGEVMEFMLDLVGYTLDRPLHCLRLLEPSFGSGEFLLADRGQLAFICADRWTKNQYGRLLRAKVAEGFHLRACVDMTGTPAFDTDVIAYPAITLIENAPPGTTLVAARPDLKTATLAPLARALRQSQPRSELGISLVERVGTGDAPWVLGSSDRRALLRRLEAQFPALEDAGCKVGIGVATGADKAYIGPMETLDVEPSRKLPLVTTKDITSGVVRWRGLGVVNPFEDDGRLAEAAVALDLAACDQAACELYGLTPAEIHLLTPG